MNRNLIEEIRKSLETLHSQSLSNIARYEQDPIMTDEALIETIELAVDKEKAILSDLKAKVQEGIL